MNLKIEGYELIGRNDHWSFAVARVGDRYLGVGMEQIPLRAKSPDGRVNIYLERPYYMHVFAEVSEGVELGMQDKTMAILLTGALAEDPEHGFGGVDEWFVPEDLRGEPKDFRCDRCGDVGCAGLDCEDIGSAEDVLEEEGNEE
jgi:hypothetical protein